MKTMVFAVPASLGLTTALFIAVLASGCSSFKRDWKTAVQGVAPSDEVAGPWEGEWVSEKNGHRGRLRCLMQKTNEQTYQARLHARFWKIFSYGYAVPLTVQKEGETFRFEGQSDLGWWAGGVYSCSGTATSTNFNATYRSTHDHGIFRLGRPASRP